MKIELFKNLVVDQTISQTINKTQEIKSVPSLEEREIAKKYSMNQLDKEKLKELGDELSKFLNQFDLLAKIVYDKKYETLVVQVLRKDTMEVIKQIPPEELLEISKKLQEFVGILLRDKV